MYILWCSKSSQISTLICCSCIKCMDIPNQECWKPQQGPACDMTQEKKKGSVEESVQLLFHTSYRDNTKSVLIIHYMFWPTWPSSGKYKNMQNAWDVNCNIKVCGKKFDLIFTQRV